MTSWAVGNKNHPVEVAENYARSGGVVSLTAKCLACGLDLETFDPVHYPKWRHAFAAAREVAQTHSEQPLDRPSTV